MNIPMDGTISNFQNKLTAKGITLNRSKSQETPKGQRIFNGIFQGRNAEIKVFYNRKTNIVYKIEVQIDSKNQDVIQKILDQSNSQIEQSYIYESAHDVEDGTELHYQYYIFSTKPTNETSPYTGVIHIEPSYLYDVSTFPFSLAGYTIRFIYEDRINTSLLTPSTKEPKTSESFVRSHPELMEKYLIWGDRFDKHGCYEQSIYCLEKMLDYYKYNCVPIGYEGIEETLEKRIYEYQSHLLGSITTAYNKEVAGVYVIKNKATKLYDCISFGVGAIGMFDLLYIKLNSEYVLKQIEMLNELKRLYAVKKNDISGITLPEYWREEIDIKLPAIVGEDHPDNENGYGNINWHHKQLSTRFKHYEQQLMIEVEDDNKSILLFRNEKEIDQYLAVLRKALLM